MMRPRGIFLLEMIVYIAVIMVLMGSLAGTVGLVLHGLADNKRQEQLAVEREELDDVLRTDLRAAQSLEFSTLQAPQTGFKLRLAQPGGTVVEYDFAKQSYTVVVQGQVPAPHVVPNGGRSERGQRARIPLPSPAIPPAAVPLTLQTAEGPPAVLRSVFVNGVHKSARTWTHYSLKQLEHSTPNSTSAADGVWTMQPLKPGESINALAGHVFLMATLEYAAAGKTPRTFRVGAATRVDPQPQAAEKP